MVYFKCEFGVVLSGWTVGWPVLKSLLSHLVEHVMQHTNFVDGGSDSRARWGWTKDQGQRSGWIGFDSYLFQPRARPFLFICALMCIFNMNFVGWSWHLKVVIETAGTVHFDVLTVYRRDGFEYCCHFESLNSLDEAQRGDIIYLLQKICVEDLVK